MIMLILIMSMIRELNNKLFNELTAEAQKNPRLRQHFDLRDSEEDTTQCMLNAIEPGTSLTVHKHPNSSTLIMVLRGSIKQNIYDDNGCLTKSIILTPTDVIGYTIEANEWHNLESLESGTIIYEQKSGKYDPLTNAVFFEK